MLCITVAQDGSGDFASISEAVLAVPYDCPAQIRIGAGIYREKLVCEKKDIALQGAGADCTRLVWGDGGKLPHPDGRPTHTFRSYTAFFSGERLRVEDLTIENDAGPGAKAGQAVAAYVDSAHAVFEKVRLLGNQDTLFCAPLPEKERERDGFLGPGRFAPRRPTAQYYRHCEIAGDIDFIFGGADALFEQCTIRTAKDKIDIARDLAVPVILGRRAAGRKKARAKEAVLLPLFFRQRRTEQRILIAQQPHILKDGVAAVHISRHGLPHLCPGAGIVLDGQALHPQFYPPEKRGIAAEGVGGPAIRVRQLAAVAPHDAGAVHACADQGDILFFAHQLFAVNARANADLCCAGIRYGQHRFGHRSKIAAAILRYGYGKHVSVLPFCFYASIVYLLLRRKSTKFV